MSANPKYDKMIGSHPLEVDSDSPAPARDFPDVTATRSRRRVTWLDRWIARKMLAAVGNPPVAMMLWDGVKLAAPQARTVASLQYHSRGALLKTIINPELYFGDLYTRGEVTIHGDLIVFTDVVYRNFQQKLEGSWMRRLIFWLQHRRISNGLDKARCNIYHHYDIGNDFYRLWLDHDVMQYTCAYFPDRSMTLEQAQTAKLHHVCRKLELQPGQQVVEAGCGWGGLALFMARHYGVKVTAYNISREQVAYARAQAEVAGLTDRVKYVLDDYRNIRGEFDAFVSVGMLEHVGKGDFLTLGEVIQRCLKKEGRGLIHSIGRNRPRPMNAWIERRVFPGAYPPSLCEMMEIFEPNQLSVLDVENLRLHYSLTLRHWLQRYDANSEKIQQMMDESFLRTWRLYLCGSISAFNVGALQLFQVVFAHGQSNQVPWSRAHLYTDQPRISEARPARETSEA